MIEVFELDFDETFCDQLTDLAKKNDFTIS